MRDHVLAWWSRPYDGYEWVGEPFRSFFGYDTSPILPSEDGGDNHAGFPSLIEAAAASTRCDDFAHFRVNLNLCRGGMGFVIAYNWIGLQRYPCIPPRFAVFLPW